MGAYDRYIEVIPQVGVQYNVGNVVRDILDHYVQRIGDRVLFKRPTPDDVRPLLENFRTMTTQLMAKSFTTPMMPVAGTPMPAQWRAELDRWSARLGSYEEQVARATSPKEIEAGVLVPLFVGDIDLYDQYSGADIRTPFILANGLQIGKKTREENLAKLFDDLTHPKLPDIPPVGQWPEWAKALGVVAGVAFVVWTLGNLRKLRGGN